MIVRPKPERFRLRRTMMFMNAQKPGLIKDAYIYGCDSIMLDFVVLAALEIDTGFNVNVLTGSDGVLRCAPGGHPDTAAGSKVCIIVTPLTRGRMATVCEKVVTVTTPGDCVDVLVTDYGIAVNPLRPDLIACLDNAGIPHVTIESLKEKAYSLVGRPDDLEWEDKVVAVLEARDGTILDVVRKIKPLEL